MSYAPPKSFLDHPFSGKAPVSPFPALGRVEDSLRGQGLLSQKCNIVLAGVTFGGEQLIPSSIIYSGQLWACLEWGGARGGIPK